MEYFSKEIGRLIGELSTLPGIGNKSAQRLAFYIMNMPKEDVKKLSEALVDARENSLFLNILFMPCPMQ